MKRLFSVSVLCALLVSSLICLPAAAAPWPAPETDLAWPTAGTFDHVWNPGRGTYNGREGQLYINDHTLIYDGLKWHLFGITGVADPADPDGEDQLIHATATNLAGPWHMEPDVLTNPDAYGESHVWAPHVVKNGGTYVMFYAAGSADSAKIKYATSTDLWNWHREGIAFTDGAEARDPMVTWIDGQWVIYYTTTTTGGVGNYAVAYRTSPDLKSWSPRHIAYSDPVVGWVYELTESPFVVQRDGWWYLFIGPRGGYAGTDVYRSRSPYNFSINDYAGHVNAHAAEVVQDGASWWVTGAGWFQQGLWLAPLTWSPDPQLWQSAQNPAVAANADGRLEAFVMEPGSNNLYHRWQTAPSGSWSGWERFGDSAGAVPTVARNADGRLEVFALSPGGTGIYHRLQTAPSGGWGDWAPFGGPAGAAPVVGQNADGRLEVFALGPAGSGLFHRWQTAPSGGWSDWASFGGPAGGPPTVGRNADGRLEVFALAPGGASIANRHQLAPNGGWSDWDGAFGPTAAGCSPTLASNADGRLELLALGPEGRGVFDRHQTAPNSGWSPWASFGQWAAGLPCAGPY
ncbi:hypothetical protein ACIBHX_03660 [Nonomuraea sp. NPDC050536]|uniref:hypothetical protein n=1 Tax=Nonomuraea sp. NPDC050536 TaxID=3364366 RepID=UPI0037C9DAC1